MAVVFIILNGLFEWYTFVNLRKRWIHWDQGLRITIKTIFFFFLSLSLLSVLMIVSTTNLLDGFVMNFWISFVMWNALIKGTLALFLFLDDIRRLSIHTARKIRSKDHIAISRSEFLLKSGLAAATVPLFGLGWGMIAGPYRYRVFNEKIKLSQLPPAFNGLKIVQISDIHAGSFYDTKAVESGIDLILEQKPDVIFFTGDLVNDRADEMEPYIELFKRVKAPLGVFSVLGNHDYGDYASWNSTDEKAANLERLKGIHDQLGWQLLMNDHAYLCRGDDKIAILGVENWGKDFIQKADLDLACNGCDAPVKLLLSHDPTHFDEVIKQQHPEIAITFSGHTHGAQMGIETGGFKWSPISLRYSKWAGLYEENGQYLYINRGFGFIGYAGRLGIMPEITVMELTS